MIIDNLGLPKDIGASDLQDSARLAGVMSTFSYPINVPLEKYVVYFGKYVRHPEEYRYTFSRDQTICLFSGLLSQNLKHLVDPNYKTEGDLVDPAVRGHFRRCSGGSSTWFQDLWLYLSVLYHALYTPTVESNQLICMLMSHSNKKYLRLWCNRNAQWKKSITDYWSEGAGAWRGEPELAKVIIEKIEGVIR